MMQFKFFRQFIVVIFFLLFLSCDGFFSSFSVLLGNYLYEQGRYQEAVIRYFKVLKKVKNPQVIYFNLGAAYYALGETESAIRMWSNLLSGKNDKLKGMAAFNRGVAYYQLGNYDESVKNFRHALYYLSDNFETKISFELALNKRNKAINDEVNSKKVNIIDKQEEEINMRTLEYLHRRNLYFRPKMAGEEEWHQEENDW